MSFWQAGLSSFGGAFLGFLSALAVFYFQERWKKSDIQESIVENLKLELAYNINLYQQFEGKIQECIEAVSNEVRSIYLNLDYEFIGTHFAREFYRNGLLLKYFHPEDMRRWNVMLNQVGTGADTYISERIDGWREGKENNKDSLYIALKHERDQLKYAREMSQYIRSKL